MNTRTPSNLYKNSIDNICRRQRNHGFSYKGILISRVNKPLWEEKLFSPNSDVESSTSPVFLVYNCESKKSLVKGLTFKSNASVRLCDKGVSCIHKKLQSRIRIPQPFSRTFYVVFSRICKFSM